MRIDRIATGTFPSMTEHNASVRGGGTPYPARSVGDSCDACDSQEDRHYCLLHSRQMKNMDTLRCDDWAPRDDANKKLSNEDARNDY